MAKAKEACFAVVFIYKGNFDAATARSRREFLKENYCDHIVSWREIDFSEAHNGSHNAMDCLALNDSFQSLSGLRPMAIGGCEPENLFGRLILEGFYAGTTEESREELLQKFSKKKGKKKKRG